MTKQQMFETWAKMSFDLIDLATDTKSKARRPLYTNPHTAFLWVGFKAGLAWGTARALASGKEV